MAVASKLSRQPDPIGPLRIIVLADSSDDLVRIRRLLAERLPDVEVTEFDTEQQGKPGRGFDWSIYDVVFLDEYLGMGDTGLAWLEEFRAAPAFPPAVLMSAENDEYIAARAIKCGAYDCINKRDVTSERLGDIVTAAVAAACGHREFEVTLPEERVSPHLAILEALAQKPDAPAVPDGDSVGYRFVRLIGQGASSRVYLAERTSDATTLVLKVIDTATIYDVQVIERFMREAELVATISSPYVVRFFDHGVTQTYGYIAMEFFTRGDLKQRMEHGVAIEDAVNYLRHIARGLHAIHQQGIIHRDLKPGNIMFRADESLALADFGIAKRHGAPSDLTNLGSVIGTPNYLSPEQAQGHDVDHRADLYSAGIILFEMLAGTKPFRAETPAALVYQHVHAAIPSLPESVSEFQPLVDQLLIKDPCERIQSASALIDAIDQVRGAPSA